MGGISWLDGFMVGLLHGWIASWLDCFMVEPTLKTPFRDNFA